MKFRVVPISLACDCPFYLEDTKGKNRCFIKESLTLSVAQSLVEPNEEWDDDIWKEDCGGERNACSVIPLFYTIQPEDELYDAEANHFDPFEQYPESEDPGKIYEENLRLEAKPIEEPVQEEENSFEYNQVLLAAAAAYGGTVDNAVAAQKNVDEAKQTGRVVYGHPDIPSESQRDAKKLNRVEDLEPEDLGPSNEEIKRIQALLTKELEKEQELKINHEGVLKVVNEEPKEEIKPVPVEKPRPVFNKPKVEVYKVLSPYAVKLDALVYPVDNTLLVDDEELIQRTKKRLDGVTKDLFKKLGGKIPIGEVYSVGNGGEGTGVHAKNILLSVVAGTGKQVRPEGIISSTQKALLMAEKFGVHTLGFIPPDKGMLDLDNTVRVHLGAIREFLKRYNVTNLTHIFILMDDEESKEVYDEYMDRIFYDY